MLLLRHVCFQSLRGGEPSVVISYDFFYKETTTILPTRISNM